ncbi:MAG: ABC transporter ATP-binding protein [Verrucomicrobiota bacterium JB023]|nr:ABC transporter ATP-binding protein [Verrucomicrobiota bacterium JB023]
MFAEFRPLFPHLKPQLPKFLVGLAAGALYGVASGAGIPALTKTALPIIFNDEEGMKDVPAAFTNFVEAVFGSDQDAFLIGCCLFIPFIMLLRAVGGFISATAMSEVGLRSIEGFRGQIFGKLLELPMGFFGRHTTGDLLSRIFSDAGILQTTVTNIAGDLVRQPILLISAVSLLIWQALFNEGVLYALIGGLSVPLLVFPIRAIGKRLRKRSAQTQAKAGEVNGLAAEVIQNPLEVRAYNLQENFNAKFRKLIGEWLRLSLKMVRYNQFLSPTVEIVAAVGFAVSLYLGARHGMSFDDFMLTGFALYMAYEPVKKLGALHGKIEKAKAAMERMETIIGSEETLAEPAACKAPAETVGRINFQDVRFAYGEDEVLRGLSVAIEAGETVALVGESGGGKTTFANLIPRFYDVSSGSVQVDGVDVRDYAKAELRSRIALVPQMPVLFRGTIRDNILMGRPDASDAEVEEAARRAFAHDFILRQEKGYETKVSEKGSSLSGGQRQRIAIARAFLKNAPILILDEATSALDAESEARVQDALQELMKDRTTLIITHRESTLAMADRVLAFDKGIVQSR